MLHKCNEPITGSRRILIRPVTVKVVCTILSSPETSLHWTAPHLTLIHDFSNIRLSRPGGCIDHSGSLAERRRRSPHDQAGSGIRTRNLTITKPMINQLSYLAVHSLHPHIAVGTIKVYCVVCKTKCGSITLFSVQISCHLLTRCIISPTGHKNISLLDKFHAGYICCIVTCHVKCSLLACCILSGLDAHCVL